MSPPSPYRPDGVLIVRVWTERDVPGLRARVIEASDGDISLSRADITAAGIDEICAVLRTWLEQIADPPPHTERVVTNG